MEQILILDKINVIGKPLALSWNEKFHWTISCRILISNESRRIRSNRIIRGMVLSWNKIRWTERNEAELEHHSRLVLSRSVEFRLNTSMIGRITPLERASSALYMLM